MKKVISLILALVLLATLLILPASADGEVYVAAGNTVLPLTSALPIRSSGVWYIDYQCLTKGNLGVSTSYNASERTLVLYTWDTTLIFNLDETTAYTTAEKVKYKAVAFASSGTVYVPVQFTAQMLGLKYTYYPDIPVVRIYRPTDIPSDMFEFIAEEAVAELKNSSPATSPDSPATPSTQPKPDTQTEQSPDKNTSGERKYIALTFNITDGKNLTKILDALSRYGYTATFFVQGSAIDNCEDALRRIVTSGHTLGTLSQNGNADFSRSGDELQAALSETNDRLFEVTKTKTRLCRAINGSRNIPQANVEKLISLGYRIWDQTITPPETSASGAYNHVVSRIDENTRSYVLTLSDSDAHTSALTRILKHFSSGNFSVYAIDILDTPVNQISEKR